MSYSQKFEGLIDAIKAASKEGACLVVNSPGALGDDYGELVESLRRIAAAGVALRIVPERDVEAQRN